LEIANIDVILNAALSRETTALLAEFKLSLNAYLKELVASPVRALANDKFSDLVSSCINQQRFPSFLLYIYSSHEQSFFYFLFFLCMQEMIKEFRQDIFLATQATNGIGNTEKAALLNLAKQSRDGFEKVMKDNKLDALVTPSADAAPVLAIGGFPTISVPAGYDSKGVPFGISFGRLKGSEPKLIEISYGFEQATMIRKPPPFKP
jgi:amidase